MDDDDDDCLLLVVDFEAGFSQLVDGDGKDVDVDVLDARRMPSHKDFLVARRRIMSRMNLTTMQKQRKENDHG